MGGSRYSPLVSSNETLTGVCVTRAQAQREQRARASPVKDMSGHDFEAPQENALRAESRWPSRMSVDFTGIRAALSMRMTTLDALSNVLLDPVPTAEDLLCQS